MVERGDSEGREGDKGNSREVENIVEERVN